VVTGWDCVDTESLQSESEFCGFYASFDSIRPDESGALSRVFSIQDFYENRVVDTGRDCFFRGSALNSFYRKGGISRPLRWTFCSSSSPEIAANFRDHTSLYISSGKTDEILSLFRDGGYRGELFPCFRESFSEF
jgi:hypothetical protein